LPGAGNADLSSAFISMPQNFANVVRGAEVYCSLRPVLDRLMRGVKAAGPLFPRNRNNDKNLLLAYEVQRALTRSLAVEDRGDSPRSLVVLRDAAMPAILIEAGFMSHPRKESEFSMSATGVKSPHAIVEGLLAYKGASNTRYDTRARNSRFCHKKGPSVGPAVFLAASASWLRFGLQPKPITQRTNQILYYSSPHALEGAVFQNTRGIFGNGLMNIFEGRFNF